jgi:hypothetical protein
MPNALLTVVGLVLAAATAPATILSVPGQGCVGEGTPYCPGTLEMFSGSPGTFLAGAVAQISGDFGPFNVPSAGTITSAVFRHANGELGYYYQIALNEDAPFGIAGLSLWIPHRFATFRANVDSGQMELAHSAQ